MIIPETLQIPMSDSPQAIIAEVIPKNITSNTIFPFCSQNLIPAFPKKLTSETLEHQTQLSPMIRRSSIEAELVNSDDLVPPSPGAIIADMPPSDTRNPDTNEIHPKIESPPVIRSQAAARDTSLSTPPKSVSLSTSSSCQSNCGRVTLDHPSRASSQSSVVLATRTLDNDRSPVVDVEVSHAEDCVLDVAENVDQSTDLPTIASDHSPLAPDNNLSAIALKDDIASYMDLCTDTNNLSIEIRG